MMARNFTINEWLVEARLGRLTRKTDTVHLEPQVMKVLVYLAAHAREVVTKEQLIGALWRHTVVSDAALARCISQIRQALGDSAKKPRYIETVPKIGYRLIAEVGDAEVRRTHASGYRRLATAAAAVLLLSIGQSGGLVEPAGLPGIGSAAYEAYVYGQSAYRNTTYTHNQNAIALFEKAVQLEPNFALAHAGLADSLTQQARYWSGERIEEALASARTAVELDPSRAEIHTAMGTALVMSGDVDGGLDAYQRALQIDPGYWPAALDSANLYFKRLQFEKAEALYLRVLQKAPNHDVAMSNLGYLYLKTGEVEKARRWLNRALQRLPLQAQAASRLAMLEMFTGHPNDAVSRCSRVRKAFPGHYACLQVMGVGSLMTGDFTEALQRFEDVVANFPDDRYARLGQAQVLLAESRHDDAMKLVDEVLAASMANIEAGEPESYDYWLAAAGHTLRGDVESAYRWFDEAANAGRRFFLWDANDPLFASLHGDSRFDRYIAATRGNMP